MTGGRARRFLVCNQGATAVEFALVMPAFLALVLGGLSVCVLLYSNCQPAGRGRAGRAMLFRRLWRVRQRFGRASLCQGILLRARRSDLHCIHARLRPSDRRHGHAGARHRADERQRAIDRERLLSLIAKPLADAPAYKIKLFFSLSAPKPFALARQWAIMAGRRHKKRTAGRPSSGMRRPRRCSSRKVQ